MEESKDLSRLSLADLIDFDQVFLRPGLLFIGLSQSRIVSAHWLVPSICVGCVPACVFF